MIEVDPETLLIIAGPPLHGKTTAGKLIAQKTNFEALDVDDLREVYFPNILAEGGVRDRNGDFFLPGDAEVTTVCYHLALERIEEQLSNGVPTIFTGALSKQIMKEPLLDLIARHKDIDTVVVKLSGLLSKEAAEGRIAKRLREGSNSPIVTFDSYQATVKLQSPWPESDLYDYYEVAVGDSAESVADQISYFVI